MGHLDWINLFAALGSCGAAIAAVWIATCDRRERRTERLNAAQAQAMLVRVDPKASRGVPGFDVWVQNFGTLAVLDVEVDSATFTRVPRATFKVINADGPKLKAVSAEADRQCLLVEFLDANGESVIAGRRDSDGNFVKAEANDEDLDVRIRFMDAHGNHWLRSPNSVKLDKRAKAL